jgi:hypothetical protein
MSRVWDELRQRDRRTGALLHPARPPAGVPARCAQDEQEHALGEVLHFTWRAASDRIATSKVEKAAAYRAELKARARQLRQWAAELMPSDATEAELEETTALLRAADKLDEQVQSVRSAGDALTVSRHRDTDHVATGVQIAIGAFMLERFGVVLERTVGTLAAVALGRPRLSGRAARSALIRSRTPAKAAC